MPVSVPFSWCLVLLPCLSATVSAQFSISKLQEALTKQDEAAIRLTVAEGRRSLGDRAGEPEEADRYQPVPWTIAILAPSDVQRGFSRDFEKLESLIVWKVGMDPTQLTVPLRAAASVLSGNLAAARGKLDGADRSLEIAEQAAAFLLWAQQQAGKGLYPFPAARGNSQARAMQVATRFLDKAEASGKWDQVVRRGWAYEDLGDGGLQFDNGECGIAIFELYRHTRQPIYVESARQAADWAASRPLCPNWNYNSFSVDLLAEAYAVTQEASYLEIAIQKARLGVIPGQLTEGQFAGRWMDPHNARPPYHYIMLRSLTRLLSVMPANHPARGEVEATLSRGLLCRNREIVERGVMNKDKAMEALLLVNSLFRHDPMFLESTQSRQALVAVSKLVSEEYRRGKHPLGPREWGLFLEAIQSGALQ